MNDNNNRSKVRRVRVVTRKWSMEEEQEILHYIKRYLDNLQLPDDGPKMSACYFFEKMSSEVKFDVISPSQLRNKVRNLQQKYLKAVELRQQMEHILDNETMLNNILSICPHWYLLHEIFGSRASSALPFQFSMNQTIVNGEAESHPNENDIKIEPLQFADDAIGDSDFSGDLAQSSDSFQCHDNFAYHSRDNQNDSHVTELPSQQSPRRKDAHQQRPPEIADEMNSGHTSKLLPTDNQNQPKSPSDDHSADMYQLKYLKLIEQRCKLDAQRLLNENNVKMKEIQLSSERNEFEKMCRLKEIDLKRLEIESNERVRLLQLEKEERMEKLKLELDFKIQMAKLAQTKANQF